MTLKGYAGSVAMAGGRLAITAPRGNRLHIFGPDGTFLSALHRDDVCGVARSGQDLIVTDGFGGILDCTKAAGHDSLTSLRKAPRNWDNHIVAIG